MPTLYIETTIVSYLAARPANNITDAARQLSTHEWWAHHRSSYQLFTSVVVVREAEQGDTEAAERRLAYLNDVPSLALTPEAIDLAQKLLDNHALPQKAKDDALHIALASVYGLEYILTWNFRHIANAAMRTAIEQTITQQTYRAPIIATPDELLSELPFSGE